MWLPSSAAQDPVPALLEYIPYRKNDFTALRDSVRHRYFAGHGYGSVRVDMRGSGDSDGVLLDEYLLQEQDDALEVIAWLAAQPWCTGHVGMFGKSWGGFNALQVAARRPPALKAIISLCSTDDRFETDIHYCGGLHMAADHVSWSAYMLAFNARPPDPAVVGDSWRRKWLERLENTPPYLATWLRHQTKDEYWMHGSVCQDFAAIQCPVMAVSGWADGYPDSVFRLLHGLRAPCLGIVGPWAHEYPEVATPGPAIGFLQEALRWWQQWLKGRDTGIMQEPVLRAYVQESAQAQHQHQHRRGHWVGVRRLDMLRQADSCARQAPLISQQTSEAGAPGVAGRGLEIPGFQYCGMHAGVWCNFGGQGDFASEQREDDGLSACFDAAPVSGAPVDYLGFPHVAVTVTSEQALALLAVRLVDVSAAGDSTMVSLGLQNLCHRTSPPSAMPRGEPVHVEIRLKSIGHRLLPGHRWRLAISSTCWPRAWPSPCAPRVRLSHVRLHVPLLPVSAEACAFAPPEAAEMRAYTVVRPETRRRCISVDLCSGLVGRLYSFVHSHTHTHTHTHIDI